MASYFNADYYFAAKAKQLSKTSDGKTWTTAEVQAEFTKLGLKAEDHYKAYGASEGLSPNAYFNETEYLASKLAALQDTDPTWANKTVADLKAEFKALGINAADHYEQYGAFETRKDGTLLNPSNAFDANAYFSAKLAQLQKIGFEGADTMTVAGVVKAMKEAGLSPVAHLQAYGAAEAKTDGIPLVQTVPSEQRVPNDPTRAEFGELVPSNYNPPSKAPAVATPAPVTKPADVGGLSAAKPVPPTAPVKVPGDTGYIAPPANLVDTNEKHVLPPTTTLGTGPNAGFIVVDITTGKGTVIDPVTGAEKGTVDVVVKPDGTITPPAANAPVYDKDGNNINDKPVDDTGKPIEPTPPAPDEGDGGGDVTVVPTFAVTKDADGKYTMGTGNGAVTVTEGKISADKDAFVFTPTTGSPVTMLKTDISVSLTVNIPVVLKGAVDILAGITGLAGTGGAELTGETVASVAHLAKINAALGTVTLNDATNNSTTPFTDSAANLAAAFDGITSLTGAITIDDTAAATLPQLKTIKDATAGTVTLNAKTIAFAYSDSAADLAAAFDGITAGLTGTITIADDSTASLAELVTINGATTGAITLGTNTAAANFSGSSVDLLAAFDGVTSLTGNITVTDDTITATQLIALDAATTGAVSTNAAGGWTITGLNGKTVAATSSVDTFVFTTTETSGVAITDFALADDSVNVSGLTDAGTTNAFTFEWKAGETVPDAKIIAATNDIFKIETNGANDADGAASAATAINSAVTAWTTTDVTSAYFVIVDSDSTGIFKFVENSAAGIQGTELTLIGTVDDKLTTENFDFAVIS